MTHRLLVLVAAAALASSPRAEAQSTPPAPEKRPLRELPYTPSLDPLAMDRGVDPCQNFHQYACGGWIRQNPIPPDRSRWSVYAKTADENQQFLWGLLEEMAQPDERRTPAQQKIGDHFAACMGEAAIEAAGSAPIAAELAAVEALADKAGIAKLLGFLHPRTGSGQLAFGFGANPDFANSSQTIAFLGAGGRGLPDRDYYLKDDARSQEIRAKYLAHVERMLGLAGVGEIAANAAAAADVMRIETALAQASLSRAESRDARKLHNPTTREGLRALAPSFAWDDYLTARGLAAVQDLNVAQPAFVKALETLVATEPLAAWKSYLRWGVVNALAEHLSTPFVKADFEFFAAYLQGQKALAPRWKRCVRLVDDQLGEALGEVFVQKVFSAENKRAAIEMTDHIRAVLKQHIDALDWMSPQTKAQAQRKLQTMRNKVGYPDRFRNYGGLEIRRGDYMGNVTRATQFEADRQLGRVGKAVDRDEWFMTPPTVNAYYNPSNNDINFPAGVLLPPLFDLKLDAAPNYGNTGATIGHEIIHGFDDSGARFDADGNLKNWWTEADGALFEQRVDCVRAQYGGYTIVDDIKINGQLTSGEDVADIAGTILAYEAWKRATAGQPLAARDGLTPDQRFFVGFAQWACGAATPESLRQTALTDPHSPAVWRINGVVANMPEFAAAFACKAGAPMVKAPACKVW